jgi:hypothetical protein
MRNADIGGATVASPGNGHFEVRGTARGRAFRSLGHHRHD